MSDRLQDKLNQAHSAVQAFVAQRDSKMAGYEQQIDAMLETLGITAAATATGGLTMTVESQAHSGDEHVVIKSTGVPAVGATITGSASIPDGTTIKTVDRDTGTLTLSHALTGEIDVGFVLSASAHA